MTARRSLPASACLVRYPDTTGGNGVPLFPRHFPACFRQPAKPAGHGRCPGWPKATPQGPQGLDSSRTRRTMSGRKQAPGSSRTQAHIRDQHYHPIQDAPQPHWQPIQAPVPARATHGLSRGANNVSPAIRLFSCSWSRPCQRNGRRLTSCGMDTVRHWAGRVSLSPVRDQMTIPWQTMMITSGPGSPAMAVRSAAEHRSCSCDSGSQERAVPSGHSPPWASKSSTAARTSSADRQLNVLSGSHSRRSNCTLSGSPRRTATIAAVCRARVMGEATTAVMPAPTRPSAASRACLTPRPDSGAKSAAAPGQPRSLIGLKSASPCRIK
jgi:hypothetical protein